MRVTYIIDDRQFEIDLDKKLHVPSVDTLTPAKLMSLMAEQPAVRARWSVLANRAHHDYEVAKVKFEVWERERHKYYRSMLMADSKRKATERMIEEEVMSDPEYKRRMEELLDLQENASNVRSIAFSFGDLGDRLANISSLMKQEMSRQSSALPDRGEGSQVRSRRPAVDSDRSTDSDDTDDSE